MSNARTFLKFTSQNQPFAFVLAAFALIGCSSDASTDDTASGGSASTEGGAPASGGKSTSGGTSATSGGGGGASIAGGSGFGGAAETAGTSSVGGRGGSAGDADFGGNQGLSGSTGHAGSSSAGATSGGASGNAGNGNGGASGSGGSGGSSGCGVVPVDPKATQQAKNLLCFLYSQYKNHVLSGQQETSWQDPESDISFYVTNTKKYPAILGGDFLYTGTNPTSEGTTTSRAQAYWAAGGIPMFRYHMGAPPNSDTYENSMLPYSSTQCNNVLTSGTTENKSYLSKMDYVAGNLLTLQSAGAAAILALFHETQPNGWFWWSKCSSSQFIALYKLTYDYLVNTKGVHNIVRLMPFSGSPSASYFPGKDLVDISGPDTYDTSPPFGSLYSSSASFIGSTMPIPLHETGTIPQPSTMFPSTAPWLLWNVWATYETNTSINTVAKIQSAYASSYTVTRDEIPSLK